MKKFLKKALCFLTALTMTLSLSGCDAFLDALNSALTPSSGSVSWEGSTSGGGSSELPDSSSTGGASTGGNSSTGGGSSTGGSTSTGGGSMGSSNSSSSGGGGTVDPELPDDKTAKLDIHFLELGNKYTGDCTYIKAGDTDILIDAGSRKDSATTISNYVNQYCTDGKLEYVIATHAHQDHIAGFVGDNNQGIFDVYRIGTLIDFPREGVSTQIYNNYETKRSNIIAKGTKHYTALEWWKEEQGLTRSIEIADGITMNVLYQKYYEESTSNENDYSVCVMFSQGDNHYLFTGDLEKSGEESLVQSNKLPKVKLYKAGHHGSKTSSNTALMSVIQPEIVCVCCCAGSSEFNAQPLNTFPTQDFINRVAPYTDKIYVTSLSVNYSGNQTVSMNGNIVVSSMGGALTVNCSNNNTILKETAWFKANRTWPSNGV
ncbi:MAG: MBL fold metallo-hydrolase [Clostridia bacterium]|nr:MBL fold metallo-hydrolase [Clostridia bacterium]